MAESKLRVHRLDAAGEPAPARTRWRVRVAFLPPGDPPDAARIAEGFQATEADAMAFLVTLGLEADPCVTRIEVEQVFAD